MIQQCRFCKRIHVGGLTGWTAQNTDMKLEQVICIDCHEKRSRERLIEMKDFDFIERGVNYAHR